MTNVVFNVSDFLGNVLSGSIVKVAPKTFPITSSNQISTDEVITFVTNKDGAFSSSFFPAVYKVTFKTPKSDTCFKINVPDTGSIVNAKDCIH
jgi:hypothetical protein